MALVTHSLEEACCETRIQRHQSGKRPDFSPLLCSVIFDDDHLSLSEASKLELARHELSKPAAQTPLSLTS